MLSLPDSGNSKPAGRKNENAHSTALKKDFESGRFIFLCLTPGSPGKFLMAAFVRPYAQRVTAEIYPVQLIVRASPNSAQEPYE